MRSYWITFVQERNPIGQTLELWVVSGWGKCHAALYATISGSSSTPQIAVAVVREWESCSLPPPSRQHARRLPVYCTSVIFVDHTRLSLFLTHRQHFRFFLLFCMGNQRKSPGNEADGGQNRTTCAAESLRLWTCSRQKEMNLQPSGLPILNKNCKNRGPPPVAGSVIKLLERRIV